ncbi:hypothetical protein pdam_00024617 [Pocillopora damicornis]|uniref:Fibrous sheath-interacting protein 1 n=1 Tax=Pocillopora damicornis TaxID=46731 RepID=A0A3M6TSP0_POCDA|nr:hypothetical protein pdam_00024617 [Pocillopora damicornis]
MEIVSEGSLESISRPASCDTTRSRDQNLPQYQIVRFQPSFNILLSAVTNTLDEDVDHLDSEEDSIISPVENDVILEDIPERTATANSSVEEEVVDDQEDDQSEESASERSGHVVKQGVSQDEEDFEANLDPKVRKGLERIRKLDAILADKLKKEKEVKIHRRQLEKKWREELNQLDQQREQEGHGKIDLGVSHALALGPPTDDYVPADEEEPLLTPLFATQPLADERKHSSSPSDRGVTSSCDSWTEQDIDDVENKGSKRTPKRRGSKQSSKTKRKEQNFVKRNIELAADAGNLIPMTEAEKKRLDELLSDETDLLMVENAYSEGLSLTAGEGFTLDCESKASLAEIDSKLQELVPQEEIDLLANQENWEPHKQLDHTPQTDSSSEISTDTIGLGERILREEKEMRDMKSRLLAIEAELQTLYRETGNESEAGLSEEILARLIDVSSRTTSRSTTVSESVMSALSSARPGEEMIQEEDETAMLAILDDENSENVRPDSAQSTHRSTCTPGYEERRAQSQQSSQRNDSSKLKRHGRRSQQSVTLEDDQDMQGQSLNDSLARAPVRESNPRAHSQNSILSNDSGDGPKSRT